MIHLYERGVLIGAIENFVFHQGRKEVIDVPMFGGKHYIQGRREPDVVTFELPFFHDRSGIHELVDEDGSVMEITFLTISTSYNTSFVKAYVQSIRKT
jgi:hypothetical protein